MYPGEIELTLIPYLANSAAKEFFKAITAVLLTLYATCGWGQLTRCPEIDAVKRMLPPVPNMAEVSLRKILANFHSF